MKIVNIDLPKLILEPYYIISKSDPQIVDCYIKNNKKEIIVKFCNLKCFINNEIILNQDIPITNKIYNFIKKYGYDNKFNEDIFK